MTVKHPDDEIDDIIWSEIGSSDATGDFICYVIHSPVNAKFLGQAKSRIDTQKNADSLSPVNYFNAIERIKNSALDEVVVTDTIPLRPEAQECPKIRQLSCAPLVGETISRIAREDSVSELFNE